MCFAVLIWPVTARLLMNVIKQNSLVRRFISKEKDINAVPEYVIQKVQDWINRFPRRLLGLSHTGRAFQGADYSTFICCIIFLSDRPI